MIVQAWPLDAIPRNVYMRGQDLYGETARRGKLPGGLTTTLRRLEWRRTGARGKSLPSARNNYHRVTYSKPHRNSNACPINRAFSTKLTEVEGIFSVFPRAAYELQLVDTF